MEKSTRDFILALKRHAEEGCSPRESAIDFMSEQTMTPQEQYTPSIMLRIARQMFLDYLSTADSPHVDLSNFFEIEDIHDPISDPISETDAILTTLLLVAVRKDGQYVNGFWEDLCE